MTDRRLFTRHCRRGQAALGHRTNKTHSGQGAERRLDCPRSSSAGRTGLSANHWICIDSAGESEKGLKTPMTQAKQRERALGPGIRFQPPPGGQITVTRTPNLLIRSANRGVASRGPQVGGRSGPALTRQLDRPRSNRVTNQRETLGYQRPASESVPYGRHQKGEIKDGERGRRDNDRANDPSSQSSSAGTADGS
jgi:hypothetical protein